MAHFAELDANNVVLRVLVVGNKDTADENGVEKEEIGIAFCKSIFGEETRWVQTSYNNKFRVRYAAINGTYDSERNVFLLPKPYDSWKLNETTLNWEAPTPKPEYGFYVWNEETQTWDEYQPND